jgi:hypothetical protein
MSDFDRALHAPGVTDRERACREIAARLMEGVTLQVAEGYAAAGGTLDPAEWRDFRMNILACIHEEVASMGRDLYPAAAAALGRS